MLPSESWNDSDAGTSRPSSDSIFGTKRFDTGGLLSGDVTAECQRHDDLMVVRMSNQIPHEFRFRSPHTVSTLTLEATSHLPTTLPPSATST